MSLRDEIRKEKPMTKLERILGGVEPCADDGKPFTEDELVELGDILEDPNIATATITKLIKRHGYSIGDNTVLRYRKDVLNVSR